MVKAGKLDELRAMAKHRVMWTADQVTRAMGHVVYIAWDGPGIAAYVGKSSRGLVRPLDPKHHRQNYIREAHSMEFLCCADAAEADRLEKALIYHLQPRGNVTHMPTKRADPTPRPSLPSKEPKPLTLGQINKQQSDRRATLQQRANEWTAKQAFRAYRS